MLLSDRDIRSALDAGRIRLDPLDRKLVQPASIDVRLDRYFRLFDNHRYSVIDPAHPQPHLTRQVEASDHDPFVLHPGEFVLGATYEKVELCADIAARLEGKSSLGRLGLLTHSTAGFIDPGFSGHVTLELSNTATMPILLYPGMRIGQLCFFTLSSPAQAPYGSAAAGSHYQGQRGPTPSRSHVRFDRITVGGQKEADSGANLNSDADSDLPSASLSVSHSTPVSGAGAGLNPSPVSSLPSSGNPASVGTSRESVDRTVEPLVGRGGEPIPPPVSGTHSSSGADSGTGPDGKDV